MTRFVEPGRRTETGGSSGIRGSLRRGREGQSLAEFALVLPVLLLIVLLGLDLGRAFFSWVTLNNAARVAANYAGLNPDASFAAASAYDTLVRSDASNAACVVAAGAPPQPVFTDSALDANATTKDLGDDVTVTISCPFRVITPLVGGIIGNPLTISASSRFTVRIGPFNP
jgi:Flp pilus assembly protein TadG